MCRRTARRVNDDRSGTTVDSARDLGEAPSEVYVRTRELYSRTRELYAQTRESSGWPAGGTGTARFRFMRKLTVLLALSVILLLTGCDENGMDSPTSPDGATTFLISACDGQTFFVRLTDPAVIQQARSLVGQGQEKIITGALARGNGGFNSNWSWHLVPGTISFADVTTEVCDGCPQMVEDDVDYWVDTVGQFCPWTTRVVRELE